MRKHYIEHKDEYKKRARNRERRAAAFVQQQKAGKTCTRCPESDPICLDFHHLDGTKKERSIAQCASHGWSIKRLIKEIEKCILLCANCHRKEHKFKAQSASQAS